MTFGKDIMSVVLAAEYLGQKAEDVAASLPKGFSSASEGPEGGSGGRKSSSSHKKHKKQKKSRNSSEGGCEEGEGSGANGGGKRHKKKRKHRPVSVKQLVDKLEPKLFQVSHYQISPC